MPVVLTVWGLESGVSQSVRFLSQTTIRIRSALVFRLRFSPSGILFAVAHCRDVFLVGNALDFLGVSRWLHVGISQMECRE